MKKIIKKISCLLGINLTKNIKYDILTQKIISKVVNKNSICIDIGAHKGEILDLILKYSPNKKHFAFEPIPKYYNNLKKKYIKKCNIFSFALSNEETKNATFQYVKNAPAFSGIKRREYSIKNPKIEEINVEIKLLDNIIPAKTKIDLIKIDVEGAEFFVIKGAKKTITKNKPVIIFECGMGASNYYKTLPEDLFDYIKTELFLNISTLLNFYKEKQVLTRNDFCNHFKKKTEHYFVAHK